VSSKSARGTRAVRPCHQCAEPVAATLMRAHQRIHAPAVSRDTAMHGVTGPAWWVRWRGWRRITRGLCPVCCSSPPRPDCPVCRGTFAYGPRIPAEVVTRWRIAWVKGAPR
jgi:hypothetical protein